ncbi:MAG: dipeptidase [Planctomycetota bacterium]
MKCRRSGPFIAIVLLVVGVSASAEERPPIELSERAKQLHAASIVVDGHNDLPWELRSQADSDLGQLDIAKRQPSLQTDLPRLREGGVGVQWWSVWVPTLTALRGESLQTTLEQIELVETMARTYPASLKLARTSKEVDAALAEGKIASLMGVEGGHCIEGSLNSLRLLYDRGARYMTLTHSDSLAWADSATDDERVGGLNEFGREVVREMNRLGMIVDISHVSPATMHQTLDTTAAPVIFSHSSCRAVADHPRNVPDDVLARLPENRGVVMINFFSAFVVPAAVDVYKAKFDLRRELQTQMPDNEDEVQRRLAKWSATRPMPRGTIHDVLDHIDHAVRIAGADHVGLGSDYDGVSVLPTQLEDVSTYPYLTQGMLDRGHSEADIKKILGQNALRVFRDVEAAAERLAASSEASP